jgi:fatty-acyl-CoA synthase
MKIGLVEGRTSNPIFELRKIMMHYDPKTLSGFLSEMAITRPEAPALEYRDSLISYKELDMESRRVAGGLRKRGVGPGDRIAVWLPNVPAYVILCFALSRLGAIAVAVNTRYRSLEVEDILGRSRAKVLAFWPGFKDLDFVGILRGVNPQALSSLEMVVVYEEGQGRGLETILGRPCLTYEELKDAPPHEEVLAMPGTPCNIFTTSGTTKAPKFVLHNQRTLTRHAQDVARAFGFGQPDTITLQSLPLCGVFGWGQTLGALAGGGRILVRPLFDPVEAGKDIITHQVTHMMATDAMFARMIETLTEEHPFPSLKVCGFAAFSPNLDTFLSDCQRRGLPIAGIYGMSEVMSLFSVQRLDDPIERRGQAGGYPVSKEARVRVRDPETGAILPPGQSGEIEIKGPSLMVRYDGNPEATAEVFTEDGFLRTGDAGYIREDGSFVFETRMGDVLRLAGFLVSPTEIEAYIERHPQVVSAQVVGVNTPKGPRALAFVILRDGAGLDEEALRTYCQEGIANYKVPMRFVALDAFPVTVSANATKIQRKKLRDLAQQIVQGSTSPV